MKRFSGLLLLAFAAVAFAGCGEKEVEVKAKTDFSEQKVKVDEKGGPMAAEKPLKPNFENIDP